MKLTYSITAEQHQEAIAFQLRMKQNSPYSALRYWLGNWGIFLASVGFSLLRSGFPLAVRLIPVVVSGVLLGGCYAMGAAAPLIFTGAVIIAKVPKTVMKPAMALPYHLYMLLTQGTSSENAYGTAFVMMVIVLLANSIATWFAWRRKK